MTRILTPALAAALLLAGCKPDATAPSTPRAAAAQSDASAPAGMVRNLSPEWYLDSDGNAVPDFVEVAEGDDPRVDRCLTTATCAGGGDAAPGPPQSVLLVLDASGSMRGAAGGQTKMDLAKAAVSRFLATKPAGMEVGLLAYGHRGDNTPSGMAVSCAGVELVSPIGGLTAANAPQVLARFEPVGWTPIAAALSEAGVALSRETPSRLVLVSDGVETCGGDPAATVRRLRQGGLPVTVDVIGFDVARGDARQLAAVAAAGDGRYYDVRTADQFAAYFEGLRAALAKEIGGFVCEANAFNRQFRCDSFLAAAFARRVNRELMSGLGRGDPAARAELLAQLEGANIFVGSRHEATAAARDRADAHMDRAGALGRKISPP
jgi:hypothetical protein